MHIRCVWKEWKVSQRPNHHHHSKRRRTENVTTEETERQRRTEIKRQKIRNNYRLLLALGARCSKSIHRNSLKRNIVENLILDISSVVELTQKNL